MEVGALGSIERGAKKLSTGGVATGGGINGGVGVGTTGIVAGSGELGATSGKKA